MTKGTQCNGTVQKVITESNIYKTKDTPVAVANRFLHG